jgi:hypothetical protein
MIRSSSTTTGSFQVADSLIDSGWRPPWKTPQPHWAHLVVARLPERVAVLLEAPVPITPWLVGMLHLWRNEAIESRIDEEASFFYFVLAEDPGGVAPGASTTAASERGFGTFPSAPEEWPVQPLAALLHTAIETLEGSTTT